MWKLGRSAVEALNSAAAATTSIVTVSLCV